MSRRARSVTVYDVDATVPFALAVSGANNVAVVDSVFEVRDEDFCKIPSTAFANFKVFIFFCPDVSRINPYFN